MLERELQLDCTLQPRKQECHYLMYSIPHLWLDVSSTSLSTSPSSSSEEMPRFCRRGVHWSKVGKGIKMGPRRREHSYKGLWREWLKIKSLIMGGGLRT